MTPKDIAAIQARHVSRPCYLCPKCRHVRTDYHEGEQPPLCPYCLIEMVEADTVTHDDIPALLAALRAVLDTAVRENERWQNDLRVNAHLLADATDARTEALLEVERLTAELHAERARSWELAEELANWFEHYDLVMGLLRKRFPQQPDGSLPDWKIEDVLRENERLHAQLTVYESAGGTAPLPAPATPPTGEEGEG